MQVELKVKQTRRRFQSEEERLNATRERNRINKRKERERRKGTKSNSIIKENTNKFNYNYRAGFQSLKNEEFNEFVTLTCKYQMSLYSLMVRFKLLKEKLIGKNIIGNYFVVYEYNGLDYHIHVLLKSNIGSHIFKQLIKSLWKHGNTKSLAIETQKAKEKFINYCTKQLKPEHRGHKNQLLIDSWDLFLGLPSFDSVSVSNLTSNLIILPLRRPEIKKLNVIRLQIMIFLKRMFYIVWMFMTKKIKEYFQIILRANVFMLKDGNST